MVSSKKRALSPSHIQYKTMDSKDNEKDAATPESTSFIPPSLASFVAKAQATLDDVQHNFHFESPSSENKNNVSSVSMDQDTSFTGSMREDEDDKKLKQEVLDKLNQKNKTGVDNDDKEEYILETANLLLELDEACDEKEIVASSEQPSPIKTADTSVSQQEGGDFSDLHSRATSVASPAKSLVSTTSSVAKSVANNDAETKRDSGSSRASGWKSLLASIPSKAEASLVKSVKRGVESSPVSAAKSPQKSQQGPAASGKDASPVTNIEKPTEPSGSVSLPKDNITSPPIPSTINPMAMSAALEVTSPLPVNTSPNLSASTPELTSSSPWKKAFRSMAARLEDRVTPPTPEQQSSPVLTKQSPPKDFTSDPDSTSYVKQPSPAVPSSPPALSRQNVPPQEEEPSAMLSPAASLQKASPKAKSGLVLSPSDLLPPQSTEKSVPPPSPAVSLPKASPQATRQSGLVLSPSDSLPSPQQVTRQSGLILSPSDSLPEATPPSAEKNTVDSSPAASLATPPPQVPRQSELVLSPSDSLPARSPLASGPSIQEASVTALPQSTEKKIPTSPPSSSTEKTMNDEIVSPAASLVKRSLQSAAASLSKTSPQSAEKSVLSASSPAVSLPKASPQVPRQSGLVLSPSDSLPMQSPLASGPSVQETSTVASLLSAEKKVPSSPLPASLSQPMSAETKNEIASPQSAAKASNDNATPSSLSKASPKSAEKSVVASSPATPLATTSPEVPRQSGLLLSPSNSLPVASPPSAVAPSAQESSTVATLSRAKKSGGIMSLQSAAKGGNDFASPSSLSTASPTSAEKSAVVSSPLASSATPPQAVRQSGPTQYPSTAGKSQTSSSPSVSVSSPKTSLPPQSIEKKSPAASLPGRSPQSAAKGGQNSSSPSATSKPASSNGILPPPAASSSNAATPSLREKRGQTVSPSALLSKPPPSTAKSAAIKAVTPKKAVERRSAVPPSSIVKKDSPNPTEARSIEASKEVEATTNDVVTQRVKVATTVSSSPSASHKAEAKTTNEAVAKEQVATPVTQVSTDDDAFLPNKQSLVAKTPSAPRPLHASKSEASKRVTVSRTGARAASNTRKSMPVTRKSMDRQRMPDSSTGAPASKKTPVVSSSGSRLFQGTASSQADKKPIAKSAPKPPPPRPSTSSSSGLYRGTAASEARAKTALPMPNKPADAKKQVSVEDARAKARERIHQQKLAAEKARKEAAKAAEKQKQVSRSRTRGSKLTAEEGRALARERVKRQQATATAQPHIAPMKGKENQIRPSNKVVKSTTSVPSSVTRSSRRPTVPKSPNFATKAVLGDKPTDRRVRDGSMRLDPNPISRASGSATHGARSSMGSSGSSSRRLTVPKAPRLSTTAKYGDKPPPSLREKKPMQSASQAKPPPRKREFKPTQPVPFKFHSSKTCASEVHPAGKEIEPSLAECVKLYSRKGLRDETPATSSVRRTYKPTIPKSPEFSTISHRAMPKSTAELEEEMMEYYNSHPFKAAPVGVTETAKTGPPKQLPKRNLTQPVPFHFRSDDRAAHYKPPAGSPDPEAKDLEECKKQFHARPLPRSLQNPPPSRKEAAAPRPLTTPKPFSLSTDKRAAKSEPPGPTADEIELSKQFHARKAPKTTYVGPKSRSRTEVSKSTATPARHYAGPPKLATSARAEPREASRMASQKNAEQLARQKEQLALRKQREKHQEDMAKATLTSPPPNIEPFHLQSEARHEAYQQHLAEQLAQEEEEAKQKMLFTAKPLRLSDPPSPIHSNRPATTPRPFALCSVTRHERWQEERRQQLEVEERERQRLMNVKAMPIPDTTYKYSPVTPASQKKRSENGEERDLDSARKQAMKALQLAEEGMP